MEQIKNLLQKQLQEVLPTTNKMINTYINYCFKTNYDPKSYTKCIVKRLKFIRQKEDQLSHKMMYTKAKFQQCKRIHKTYSECIQEAQKIGLRSIRTYIDDIQKY